MTDREKLIKLLGAEKDACLGWPYEFCETCRYDGSDDCFSERFADHLIAHGVAVQKTAMIKLNKDGSATCGNCRFTHKDAWDWDGHIRYCPTCGAKLELPKEEE